MTASWVRLSWRRGMWWCALLLAFAWFPGVAEGAKGPRTAALVVVERDTPNPSLTRAMVAELQRLVAETPRVRAVSGNALRRRLKRNPARAVARCGSDLGCLARLGRKAKVREVLVVRVAPSDDPTSPDSVELSFIAVGSRDAKIRRRHTFTVHYQHEVTETAMAAFEPVFGLAAVQTPDTDFSNVELSLAPIVSEETDASEPAVDETPAAAPTSVALRVREPTTSWLSLTGVALVGLGVATAAVGGYYAYRFDSIGDSIHDDLDQPTAVKRESRANQMRERANLAFYAAGGTATLGAVLIALGVIDSDDGVPVFEPTRDGLAVRMTVAW